MKRHCLTAMLAALLASVAAADEIQLTNGHKLVGKVVKRDPVHVVIEVGSGTITLEAKEVSSINPGRTALDDYEEKWKTVRGSHRAADFLELAQWAEENKLSRYVAPLCQRVIEIDPDNASARAKLHHEKVNGKWLAFEEAQTARGLVQVDDRWITKAEVELIEKRRLEAKERAAAQAADRERRRDEERQARQAALEDYNARLAAAMSQMDGYFYSPSFAFTTPYYRPYWWAPYLRSRNYYQHSWMYGYGVIPTLSLLRPPFGFR